MLPNNQTIHWWGLKWFCSVLNIKPLFMICNDWQKCYSYKRVNFFQFIYHLISYIYITITIWNSRFYVFHASIYCKCIDNVKFSKMYASGIKGLIIKNAQGISLGTLFENNHKHPSNNKSQRKKLYRTKPGSAKFRPLAPGLSLDLNELHMQLVYFAFHSNWSLHIICNKYEGMYRWPYRHEKFYYRHYFQQ